MTTTTSSLMCLLIFLLFCLSFGYSLQGDNSNEKSSVDVVLNAKHVDDAMKKLKVGASSTGDDEFSKETTKMTIDPKKATKKETGAEEEDDLVAYTADYWKPRHHPPKNN